MRFERLKKGPPTPAEIADANALLSLVGLGPDEGFQRSAAVNARWFANEVIEGARIGYRTCSDKLWHDVLKRAAEGPAETAEMIAQARSHALSHWHGEIVEGFLHEIAVEQAEDVDTSVIQALVFDELGHADHATIVRAYQAVSNRAQKMLEEIGPLSRGRDSKFELDWFVMMTLGMLLVEHREEVDTSKPGPLVEFVATALAQAIYRTRDEISQRRDLSPEARQTAAARLEWYERRLTDDALRNRIRKYLAETRDVWACQDRAPNAIRANARN